jgi:hypothetical protein
VSRIRGAENPFVKFGRPTPWRDRDAVIKRICSALEEVEKNPFPEEPTELERAIEKARRGDLDDLIRLAQHGPRKKKRGRPRRSNAQRVRETRTHWAEALAHFAMLIMRDRWPEARRRGSDTRERAREVASAMTGVRVGTIERLQLRPRNDRRRLRSLLGGPTI